MDGVVIELDSSHQYMGVAVAHEVGHYLGLNHVHTEGNLMCGGLDAFQQPIFDTSASQTVLTSAQGDEMR